MLCFSENSCAPDSMLCFSENSCAPCNTPSRFTFITVSKGSTGDTPALLTRTSTFPPKKDSALLQSFPQSALLETSASRKLHRSTPNSSWKALLVSSPPTGFLSESNTRPPLLSTLRVNSLPKPCAAPVIRKLPSILGQPKSPLLCL